MITVYMLGVPSYYEGEDIEIKFTIYDDEGKLINSEECYKNYQKPAVVEHFAFIEVLKKLKEMDDECVEIVFNNASFLEQLNGTSTLRSNDSKRMMNRINDRLDKLNKRFIFTDVSNSADAMQNWKDKIDNI